MFTLPAPIADIAYQNKAVIYGILFKAAAETLITRVEDIARARQRRNGSATQNEPSDADRASDGQSQTLSHLCPCCGGRMIIIEIFERGGAPRSRPTVPNRIDSS